MKILLRKHKDKYYVWKTAEYKNNEYYICEDDTELMVEQINILAVSEDERSNFVKCANCGAVIKNDAESIEAHFAEREAQRNCFECTHMSAYGQEKNHNVQYTKNDNGTYHVRTECDTMLCCGFNSWKYSDINAESTKNNCQYYQCRTKGMQAIDDIFVKYPGIFNKQITIDHLIAKGFTNRYAWASDKLWCINLGLRGDTLHAFVNELGIVDYFMITHRYARYNAFYSDTYDKLFFEYYGKYKEDMPEEMSQAKYNSAKKIIKALYKEA